MNQQKTHMSVSALGRRCCAALMLAVTASFAAPQIETPGFYITTIGVTADDQLASYYTNDGDFIPLQNAAALAFAPKADIAFLVEKFGAVRVIVDDVLQPEPVVNMIDQVSDWVDSGMVGVGVHPDFPQVKEILITYTHHNGVTPIEDGSKYAKVARLTLTETVAADGTVSYYSDPPTDENVIIGKLSSTAEFPSCNDRPLGADCGAVDHSAHPFTFVMYGPDGKIYVGTGDGAGYFTADPNALYAQVDSHLSGKILRINPDGSGPDDNPFFTGNKWDNASKVFAKGLRNPKSGSFDPVTGKLCVGNVGWYTNEGIYCLSAGDNAGWPCEENGPAQTDYSKISLSRDGVRLASCPLEPGSFVKPDYSYAHQIREIDGDKLPIGAVIGCARPTAAEYPDNFKGSCVFGDYVFDQIESVNFAGGNGNPSSTLILSGAGLPTDVVTDRNGRVCYVAYQVATIDGRPVSEVRCLRYDRAGTVQQYPVPSFISFDDPNAIDIIKFDASKTYHTAGLAMTYAWDFGDGSTGTGIKAEHQYKTPGDFKVTLTAKTVGQAVERSTFQVVRVPDPMFIAPVNPSVVDLTFTAAEHTFSAPVEFDVLIRNDSGTDAFRILANIYDDQGTEVAHLEDQPVQQLNVGETTTVRFRWDTATELGKHTVSIEFYPEDWVSWAPLKYPNAAEFFVRNRASEGVSVTESETTDAGVDTPDGETTPSNDGTSAAAGKSSGGGCSSGGESGSLLWILALLSLFGVCRRRHGAVATRLVRK